MGIPFKGASKGVKDTDKARDKIFTFIQFVKELHDDTADSLKKAVEQGAVFQEKRTQFLIYSKNEMAVSTAE